MTDILARLKTVHRSAIEQRDLFECAIAEIERLRGQLDEAILTRDQRWQMAKTAETRYRNAVDERDEARAEVARLHTESERSGNEVPGE